MARIRKSAVRETSKEEWIAATAEVPVINPLPPANKVFTEGDAVAYRGERYSVLYQNGNWVRLTSGGKDGETFVVYADLLIAISGRRGEQRADALPEREAIAITAVCSPRASLREKVKESVRAALDGISTRKEFIAAGEKLGVLDDELRTYIDEIDWGCANPGILRMRLGNMLRGRLMKVGK